MRKFSFYILLLLGFTLSCQENDSPLEPVEENPSPNPTNQGPFEPYVSRFFEEAEARGFDFDRDRLDLAYMNSSGFTQFCGYGWNDFNGTGRQRVEINPQSYCWEERDEWEKEGLMFHELGHAVLARFHDNWETGTGLYGSMMCGGNNSCNQFALYNRYTPQLRQYYIDELFDRQTLLPDWLQTKTDSTRLHYDPFDLPDESWSFFQTGVSSSQFASRFGTLSDETSTGLIIEGLSQADTTKLAGWTLSFIDLDLAETQSLQLRVKIAGENITGGGAYFNVQADAGGKFNSVGFASTIHQEPITGSFPSTRYETTIGYLPDSVSAVHIILGALPKTQGIVFFDELELIVWE